MTIKPETVVIGGYHNLLIFDDKSIVVWGSNYFGQLGLGDFRRRIYPVPLDYFRTKLVPAPNLSPRDGAGIEFLRSYHFGEMLIAGKVFVWQKSMHSGTCMLESRILVLILYSIQDAIS
jgi:hypothetical protein